MPTAYETFVTDPGRRDVFLAELNYQTGRVAEDSQLRYASARYPGPFIDATISPSDPGAIYRAEMVDEIRWSSSTVAPDTVGVVLPDAGGEIVIANGRAQLDETARLAGYLWDGRSCVVRHVGYSPRLRRWLTVDEGRVVLKGETEQVLVEDTVVRFLYQDHRERLRQPLAVRRHAGGAWLKDLSASHVVVGSGTTATKLSVTGPITCGARFMLLTQGLNGVLSWNNNTPTDAPFSFRVRSSGPNGITFSHRKASTNIAVNFTELLLELNEFYVCWWVVSGADVVGHLYRERTGQWLSETETLADGVRAAASATASLRLGADSGSNGDILLDWCQVWSGALTFERCAELSRPLAADERLSADLLYYTDSEAGTGTAVPDLSAAPLADGVATTSTWRKSLGGGDQLAGTTLPEVWGPGARRVPCVLLDGLENYYAVCADQLGSVTGFALDDGGGSIALASTFTTFSSFVAASAPGAGNFHLCSCAVGTFVRTNGAPSKPLAATLPAAGQVDHVSGLAVTGPGAIARCLLVNRAGYTTDDLDEASFTDLDAEVGAVVGHYVPPDTTLEAALTEILGSVGGLLIRRRSGLLAVRRVRDPDGGPVALRLDQRHIGPPRGLPTMLPVKQVTVQWSRNWTPLTADQQSASLAAAEQMAVEQPARRVRRVRAGDVHPLGRTVDRVTSLTTEAAAVAEAKRIEALGRGYGWSWEVEANSLGFLADVLDVVEIGYQLPHPETGRPTTRLMCSEIVVERFLVLSARDSAAGPSMVLWRQGVPGVLVDSTNVALADPDGRALLMAG